MKKVRIVKEGYRCTRCGHVTVTKDGNPPARCGKCKSPYWSKQRIREPYKKRCS